MSSPPQASWKQATVPSPPSATGMVRRRQSGWSLAKLSRAIRQISWEERVPLKESEMMIAFLMAFQGFTTLMGLAGQVCLQVVHGSTP